MTDAIRLAGKPEYVAEFPIWLQLSHWYITQLPERQG